MLIVRNEGKKTDTVSYAGRHIATEYDELIEVNSVDHAEACDSCLESADYKLDADGGYVSYSCHACLRDSLNSPMNADRLI